jgi:hypothetical protein
MKARFCARITASIVRESAPVEQHGYVRHTPVDDTAGPFAGTVFPDGQN